MLLEGSRRQLRWILNHQHLIQKRRCGQDFLLKDQSILLHTNQAIFGGRTTAPWFSGFMIYGLYIVNFDDANFSFHVVIFDLILSLLLPVCLQCRGN